MKELAVWPEPHRTDGDTILVAARLELPSGEQDSLWYRVPLSAQPALVDSCDPFLLALLLKAMHQAADLTIHGQVSPSLLRGAEEFEKAWAAWRPGRYHAVGIRADDERELRLERTSSQAVVGFSGGLDSSFSALSHARGVEVARPRPLRAGVFVQGFDIPLDDGAAFARACGKARAQLASLGLETIPIATNYRDVTVDWTESYGPAVAACLMLFQGRFDTGLVAQGVTYEAREHFDEGSNPLTDPLMSSRSFQVVADGSGITRREKTRAVAGWAEGLADLRVCWAGVHKDRNCCECEKCIRTILTFRVLGFDLPACFDKDITDDQIRRLRGVKEIKLGIFYDDIIRHAELGGMGQESWVSALRSCVRANRRHGRLAKYPAYRLGHRGVRSVRRRIRQRFGGRATSGSDS